MERNGDYSLTLTGFNSQAEVKAFFDWYSGSGEQDAAYWFEERKREGLIESTFMTAEYPITWNGKQADAKIIPCYDNEHE